MTSLRVRRRGCMSMVIPNASSHSLHCGLLGLVKESERLTVDYDQTSQEVFLLVVRAFRLHYTQEGSRGTPYRHALTALGHHMGFSRCDSRLQALRNLLLITFTLNKIGQEIWETVLTPSSEISSMGFDHGNTAPGRAAWRFKTGTRLYTYV